MIGLGLGKPADQGILSAGSAGFRSFGTAASD